MKINNPTCPHCGYEFDEDETWHSQFSETGEVSSEDGDESELKCPNLDCQKDFKVICVHHITWEAADED